MSRTSSPGGAGLRSGRRHPLRHPAALARLAEIRVPTLIVVSGGDQPDILRQADLLHATITGCQKAVIVGVAHVPNMESPERFNRLVLDRLDAGAGAGLHGGPDHE